MRTVWLDLVFGLKPDMWQFSRSNAKALFIAAGQGQFLANARKFGAVHRMDCFPHLLPLQDCRAYSCFLSNTGGASKGL